MLPLKADGTTSSRGGTGPAFPNSHPFGERRSLPVAVVKTRSGIHEVEGEPVSFVCDQHRSLPNEGGGEMVLRRYVKFGRIGPKGQARNESFRPGRGA